MANAEKTHDLVVTTGEYQSGGQTKKRYKNIGAVFRNANGSYIMLDKTFNPAGVPGNADRDTIIVSMFEPRAGEGNDQRNRGGNQSGYGGGGGGHQAPPSNNIDDDEIPF